MDPTIPVPSLAPPHLRLGAERSSRRDVVHGIGLVFPWLGLAWLWWNLLRHDPSALGLVGQVVVVGVAVTLVVTLAWVAHNLAIARRKGPRRGLPVTGLVYQHDWVGRSVHAAWDEILGARVVTVTATDGVKTFVAGPVLDPARRDAYDRLVELLGPSADGVSWDGRAPCDPRHRPVGSSEERPRGAGDPDLVTS